MRQSLKKYLEEIEGREIQGFQLELLHLSQLLTPLDEVTSIDEVAVLYAFCMQSDSMNSGNIDGIYHGMLRVDTKKIFPERDAITQDIISYWHKMARETKNPILRCRCLDLVVDFTANCAKRSAAIHDFVDASIELIDNMEEVNFILLGENGIRALRLAIFSKNKDIISRILSCLILYTKRCPRVTCYLFTTASNYSKSAIKLFGKGYLELFDCLVAYVDKTCELGGPFVDPFEESVIKICDYYKKCEQNNLLNDTIAKVEAAYRNNVNMNSSAALRVHYLQELHALCSRYLGISAVDNRCDRLIKEITDLEQQVIGEMHVNTYEYKISPEEQEVIKSDVQRTYHDNSGTRRTLFEVCHIIHISPLCPPRQHIDAIINQQNPLINFFDNELLGLYGIPIGVLRHNEGENRALYEYAQYVKYMEPLYQAIMSNLVEEFDYSDFELLLIKCPLIRKADESLCKKAIEFFWAGEYIGFSATAIPLIESMFRELNRLNCQPIVKAETNSDGGYEFLALGTLCDNIMTKRVFGEDFVYFCKVILLSGFGWNIRNNFCHGLNNELFSSPSVAYRLMYILMILAIVEEKDNQ